MSFSAPFYQGNHEMCKSYNVQKVLVSFQYPPQTRPLLYPDKIVLDVELSVEGMAKVPLYNNWLRKQNLNAISYSYMAVQISLAGCQLGCTLWDLISSFANQQGWGLSSVGARRPLMLLGHQMKQTNQNGHLVPALKLSNPMKAHHFLNVFKPKCIPR